MAATIINHSDNTFTYAELWSGDPFTASTWYGAHLLAEDKGDVYHLDARWKIDVIAACFVVWEGTINSATRVLRLINAAGVDQLKDPPGPDFLPIYPGVNLIEFDSAPAPVPEPPLPAPGPIPAPPGERVPHTITVYGSNVAEPLMHWWGDDLVFAVPMAWYVEAWEAGPKKLLERLA